MGCGLRGAPGNYQPQGRGHLPFPLPCDKVVAVFRKRIVYWHTGVSGMRKWFWVLLVWLAWVPWTQATTLLRMDLDDLTAESHAIVYGKVIASRTEWDANRRWIFTIYTVQPAEYLKGHLGAVFELREPGGERDGVRMSIPSVPAFEVGQEAVLFVWTDPQEQHQVIGFEQGALAVQTDPPTGWKSVGRAIRLGSVRSATRSLSAAPVTSRFLPQLFHQIRSSVAKTRQREMGP